MFPAYIINKSLLSNMENMVIMKRLFTILALLLLAAGLPSATFAADTFDVSDACGFAMSEEAAQSSDAEAIEADGYASFFLFTRSIRSAARDFLNRELGFDTPHGQPLPGLLITLLIGAAFGIGRKLRRRIQSQPGQDITEGAILTARLLRMNILFLNPPETIHTISPGPDLFYQRE